MESFERDELALEIITNPKRSISELRTKKKSLQAWFSLNKCKNVKKHSKGLPAGFKILVCGLNNFVLKSVSGLVMVLYKDSSGNAIFINSVSEIWVLRRTLGE